MKRIIALLIFIQCFGSVSGQGKNSFYKTFDNFDLSVKAAYAGKAKILSKRIFNEDNTRKPNNFNLYWV